MGRAFVEIGILDSAHWSFERGLRYAPDDQSLLEVAAWNAGKLKKFEDLKELPNTLVCSKRTKR